MDTSRVTVDKLMADSISSNDVSEDPNVTLIYNILGVLALLYAPCIIFCNSLVLWATALYPAFHTPHNFLLFSLSMADLSMGVFCIPLYALRLFSVGEKMVITNKTTCLMSLFFRSVAVNGSLHSLLLIGIDRYIAVACPFTYYRRITKENTIKALICMWAYTLMSPSLTVFGFNSYEYDTVNITGDKCYTEVLHSEWYIICKEGLSFLICIALPACLYIHICIIACRQRRAIEQLRVGKQSQLSQFNARMTSVKISSALMVIYLVLWLPEVTAKYYVTLHPDQKFNKGMRILIAITASLVYANYMINPLVYSIGRKEYRDVYKLMSTTAPWNWKKELRMLYNQRTSSLFARSSMFNTRVSPSSFPVQGEDTVSVAKSTSKITRMSEPSDFEWNENNEISETIPYGSWV